MPVKDLRAMAERVLKQYEGRDGDITSTWNDAKDLARAVLAALDVPDDVQAAMERLRQNVQYAMRGQLENDHKIVCNHFLAHPIRIDETDREQLLRDVETVEKCASWYQFEESCVITTEADDAAKRLAAHTRRTLGEK